MKKVFKYGTGQEVPKGAIYLCSLKNGKMMTQQTGIDGMEYVWHYFLVDASGRKRE